MSWESVRTIVAKPPRRDRSRATGTAGHGLRLRRHKWERAR
ncbi:hypothetical protein ACIG56_10185 [Nocardia fusca]